MLKNRKEILNTLLNFNKSLDSIKLELGNFEWDSEELIELKKNHIKSILNCYISEELSSQQIEDWANLIEGRDDIGYVEEFLKDIIFILANPLITEPLTIKLADKLLEKILN